MIRSPLRWALKYSSVLRRAERATSGAAAWSTFRRISLRPQSRSRTRTPYSTRTRRLKTPAITTISHSGAIPESARTDPPTTLTMFAASLCAGMTRVRGPSSMGTGYENATRSVMKATPDEKTMRQTISRRLHWRSVDVLPFVLALIAAIAYGSISVYRHNVFASGAFDLGVQDQTVWGYRRLEIIPNTVEMIRNLLGDHFHPILMTIAPLYWIWDDVRVLLIVQAGMFAAGGVPIFWWARRQLGVLPAIVFEIAYLAFWGVLSAVGYDFYHIAFAVPAGSFCLYALLTKNNRLLWAMVALGLLTRENIALTFAAIGLFVILAQRRWRLR